MRSIPYEVLDLWFGKARYTPSPEQKAVHLSLIENTVSAEGGPLPTLRIVAGGEQSGKHLALDTPIPTVHGWECMGNIHVGDRLFNENGQPTMVTWVSVPERQPCYQLTFDNGDTIVASASHPWLVRNYNARKQGYAPKVRTTAEMAQQVTRLAPHNHRPFANWSIQMAGALDLPEQILPVDPYVLGAWLGDGHSTAAKITSADADVLDQFRQRGVRVGAPTGITYPIGGRQDIGFGERNSLSMTLKALGVLRNKHIPQPYLRASIEQRWDLLRGLMDTDGYVDKRGRMSFSNTNEALKDGFVELVASLGLSFVVLEGRALLYGKDCGPAWDVCFQSRERCFFLTRKFERQRPELHSSRSENTYIQAIDPVGERIVRCLAVDTASHLYLAGKSMVPTHNSHVAAHHVFASFMTAPLTWLVGNRYEDAAPEYERIREAGYLTHAAKKFSEAENGPWEGEYVNGHVVKVLSSDDVTKLAREAPDLIVMCEAGRQTYDAFRYLYRRAMPHTAPILVTGTFERDRGSIEPWYPELWEQCRGDNPYRAKSLSLPSYSNRSIYPLGERDQKFLAGIKAIRDSNQVDPDDEIAERFYGIPRKHKDAVFGSDFSRQVHVKDDAQYIPGIDVNLAIDPGYANAFAILFIQVVQEQVRVFDELYLRRVLGDDIIPLVENHESFKDLTHIVMDIAATQHGNAQQSAFETWNSHFAPLGITISGQYVHLQDRLNLTRQKLKTDLQGNAYLIFNPRCSNTIWEFEKGYRYHERRGSGIIATETPIDANNHSVSAIGYFLFDRYGYSKVRHALPKPVHRVTGYDRSFLEQQRLYAGGRR